MSPHVETNHNGQTSLRVNTGSRRVDSPKLHPVAARSSVSQPELPPRQQAVVELVCQGLTDKEIATELGLSEETVGWYLKRIFPKYGVHSRTALMVRCANGQHSSTQTTHAEPMDECRRGTQLVSDL
jgi:DNA-binding NarL/FixJ family response regulator